MKELFAKQMLVIEQNRRRKIHHSRTSECDFTHIIYVT